MEFDALAAFTDTLSIISLSLLSSSCVIQQQQQQPASKYCVFVLVGKERNRKTQVWDWLVPLDSTCV